MSPATLESYLVVGAVLFALGMVGFLARRNMIIMFLSVEMMLQGVAVNLVAFAKYRGDLGGQVMVMFILTVAACEAAVALALILALYKRRKSLDISVWQELREPNLEPIEDEEALPSQTAPYEFEHLPSVGEAPTPAKDRQEVSHV
jgi:NADH-quinone oxidoreductase subunit K